MSDTVSDAVISVIIGRLRVATATQMQSVAQRLPDSVLQALALVAQQELSRREEVLAQGKAE